MINYHQEMSNLNNNNNNNIMNHFFHKIEEKYNNNNSKCPLDKFKKHLNNYNNLAHNQDKCPANNKTNLFLLQCSQCNPYNNKIIILLYNSHKPQVIYKIFNQSLLLEHNNNKYDNPNNYNNHLIHLINFKIKILLVIFKILK